MNIMKRILPFLTLLLAISLSISAQVVSDTVSMGQGYANDIFYSFADGEVQTSDRTVWDIAFSTNMMSAAIISNRAAGVHVYEYPNGDTTHWATFDTTGMSTWPEIYNSTTTWEEGAFNQNVVGDPLYNYGWCQYNTQNHNLYGYKMYLLKWDNGASKKLWIKRKHSFDKIYVFTYSDLDNSNEEEVTLDCSPYGDKNFLHYSLMDGQLVDYEPASSSWDIVFTRYYDMNIPYFVSGALLNYNTQGAFVNTTNHSITDTTGAGFTSDIAVVGSEWKEFNMGTMSWDIPNDRVYFVHTQNGEVYRLVFTGFAGMSSGDIYFDKEAIFTQSILANEANSFEMKLYFYLTL